MLPSSRSVGLSDFGAQGVLNASAAPLDPGQGSQDTRRRGSADRRHHRIGQARYGRYGSADHRSEFIANIVKDWLAWIGVRTLCIEKASPWENGYNESFNGTLRDELLNGEVFYSLVEARFLAALQHQAPAQLTRYRPPAPETIATPNCLSVRNAPPADQLGIRRPMN